MRFITILCAVVAALALSGCGHNKFKTYRGPEVTQVIVNKGARKMYLYHHNTVLEEYPIGLGFAPVGDKKVEGDGRTPEGYYMIDKRNPNSDYHLSVGISYPNALDAYEAALMNQSPGGDIFIHGGPPKGSSAKAGTDWTWGCIALTDKQIEDVYAMVKDGTPILITP